MEKIARITNKSDVRYYIEELELNYNGNDAQTYFQGKNYHFSLDKVNEIDEHVFFVWIGSLNLNKLKYLNIWRKSYDKLHLWIDSRTILYSHLSLIVKLIERKYGLSMIESQNYFFSKCKYLSTVTITSFVDSELPELVETLNDTLDIHAKTAKSLARHYIIHEVSDEIDFISNDLERFYSYEVALRGNLAAASDIIRLSILYQYGGTYVDVDTLPNFRHMFQNSYNYSSKENVNLNLFDSYMSKIYYNLVSDIAGEIYSKLENSETDLYIESVLPHIKNHISRDIELLDKQNFVKFEPPRSIRNLVCISVNENNFYEFNNNILSCKRNSKLIKICVREMCRRYKYVEKRNFHRLNRRILDQEISINHHYERMCRYRVDNTEVQENLCTLVLSGPTLILEVLLGCTAEILGTSARAVSIAAILRNPTLGIAFENQVMYTSEHLNSSWLINKNM
jgi:hypothetical protein